MSTLLAVLTLIISTVIDLGAVWKGIRTALRYCFWGWLGYVYLTGGFETERISHLFPPTITRWERLIVRSASAYDVDPNALATIMLVESCGNPEAVSSAGAMGLMQVMPLNFMSHELPLAYDPQVNIDKGAAVYRTFLNAAGGDVGNAFAGYNGGFMALNSKNWGEETQRYSRWTNDIYKGVLSGNGEAIREFYTQHKYGCTKAELVRTPDMSIQNPLPAWVNYLSKQVPDIYPAGEGEVILPYPSNVTPTLVDNGLHGVGDWPGRDWLAPCGTPLYAPISGVVVRKGTDSYVGPYGANNSYLALKNKPLGLEVVMMHGDYIVEVGQEVVQGRTVVGVERSNGNSTDCHTHLSVKKNGQIIDPLQFVSHN
jgi:murein DD-endopeptidase MepM/ murein hydrolase activator NlpD